MPVGKLRDFLDRNRIKYVTMSHSVAFTTQEVAASTHISGWEVAKTVMVKIDGKLAMAVLPAPCRVDFDRLKEAAGASHVELASEDEFKTLFPNCEAGAMPPFGNLWNMRVYVDQSLAEDDQITFNAGSHSEVMRIGYTDFENLVKPIKVKLASTTAAY